MERRTRAAKEIGERMAALRGVSFDRAAAYYDETRRLNPEVEAAIAALLRGRLAGHEPCLEIGVGTGRIALPLVRAGVSMVGIDLSRAMMARIPAKAGGSVLFPLVQGDATRLPFRDGTFGSALACHVLHLIPPWQEAVAEAARVVRPGGIFLVEDNADGRPYGEVARYFYAAAGLPPRRSGLASMADLDATMAARGAQVTVLPPIIERGEVTLEQMIARMESGQLSSTWQLSAEQRAAAGEATRRWARELFGPLEQPLLSERQIVWREYRLPA